MMMSTSGAAAGAHADMTAAEAPARCGSVLMVGTHPSTKGGIRMLVEGYRNHGLFRRAPVKFVPTHWERTQLQKALIAIAGWFRVAWALVRLDRPLVHVHLSSQASFWRKAVICVMARIAGRPYLLHVHGGRFMRFYEESGRRSRWFIRRVFARSALVLALTEDWRTRLSRMCPEARIEVLPNGVPLPALAERASGHPPRVLFLGVLHPQKGTFDLVRAFARIAPTFPEWKLVCAGSGAIEETQALAAELGIADRVECTGWLDLTAKQKVLAEATVFALPSYAEGLPMALLEGMSWGLPAIATPVGGIPGTIRPPHNGLLVPPGDVDALAGALSQLMGSRERRDALGTAARATIEREFSLDASIEQLLRIYSRFGIAIS
jgi:glycosyltransferase involved in cell wall biosynthesis